MSKLHDELNEGFDALAAQRAELPKPTPNLWTQCPSHTWAVPEGQEERALRWFNHHQNVHGWYSGAIGGRFTYKLTPTSIGTVVSVACGACSEVLDLTDYGAW
jgi:hypothetical protein